MITVQNNFLDQKYFKELQTILTSADTSWHFHDGVNNIKDGHYMMGHCLYKNNIPTSSLYNKFIGLFEKMDISCLLRSKLNLYFKTEKVIEHGFHIDVEDNFKNLKTSIFYINTNNGYTKFENGRLFKSEENTLITFPNYLKHSGSTNTCESPTRIVLNVNYF